MENYYEEMREEFGEVNCAICDTIIAFGKKPFKSRWIGLSYAILCLKCYEIAVKESLKPAEINVDEWKGESII